MFWDFGCEASGILTPQPGAKPFLTALEGEVLATLKKKKNLEKKRKEKMSSAENRLSGSYMF